MKCDKCKQEIEDGREIETDRGAILCNSCDCARLSCCDNPEEPRTEDDFYNEIKKEQEED